MRSWLVGVAGVLLGTAGAALGAQTYIRLDTVNPGSEFTTGNVVPNPGFESFNGSKPAVDASPWLRTFGDDQRVTDPTAAFASNGASVLSAIDIGNNGFLAAGVYELFGFTALAVTPNTDYVLSAYIWNFGSAGSGINANVDFNDSTTIIPADNAGVQLTVAPGTPGAENGIFAYSTFNSGPNFSMSMRVFYDSPTGNLPLGATLAQWDNIAVTPAANFVAPTVPEPGAGAMLGVAGLLALRRRQSTAARVRG